MAQTILLGDPSFFEIKAGANPHTRGFWGQRKKVDKARAMTQWLHLKRMFEGYGIRVITVPPVEGLPGLVYPANSGFRYEDKIYLSNLHPGRASEKERYRRVFEQLPLTVLDFPVPARFEGEADFFPVGDLTGDPKKKTYLFTSGRLEKQRWVFCPGFPPYRRVFGFRSDRSVLPALQRIAGGSEVISLELVDEAHYHGDTVLCPFGPREEYLLVYLEALSGDSQERLRRRFGSRLVPLSRADGRAFAANSFQIATAYYGEKRPILLMPDGLTTRVYESVRVRGVIPCPVDVSEFMEKGGGSLKCMLLNLGEI